MNWEVMLEPQTLTLYAQGLVTTLWLFASSVLVGAVLALVLALILTSRSKKWGILRALVSSYTYVIRGTPLLIQLYLIYYGLAQLDWIQARWDSVWPWVYFKSPAFCAFLAFALNTAGYTAEMIAGSINETNVGEIEAAQAMGMSSWQIKRHIILPSALRRTLPAYSNEVVMMLHSTSLASTVPAMLDVAAAASRIYSDYYLPFEAYIFAAVIYLTITFMLVGMFYLLEKKFLAHLKAKTSAKFAPV